MYVCNYVCKYVFMYVFMYLRKCVHTYIHTYIHACMYLCIYVCCLRINGNIKKVEKSLRKMSQLILPMLGLSELNTFPPKLRRE